MENTNDILRKHLGEQIALEEHLCKLIEDQISGIEDGDFEEVKNLLINARQTLELQFPPLNELLGELELNIIKTQNQTFSTNGSGVKAKELERGKQVLSNLLREDYVALNQIAIGNTLLHTKALALGSAEIAKLALEHLGNIFPILVKIAELLPSIAIIELHKISPTIDVKVAEIALGNARIAWNKACSSDGLYCSKSRSSVELD